MKSQNKVKKKVPSLPHITFSKVVTTAAKTATVTTAIALLLSCSTSQIKHSEYQDKWALYKTAMEIKKTHPENACKIFEQLSIDEKFAAKEISTLRAFETCKEKPLVEMIYDLQISKNKPWLRELEIEISLQKARSANNSFAVMNLEIEKSKESKLQKEKVELTQHALKIAAEMNLQDKVSELTERLYKLAPRFKEKYEKSERFLIAGDFKRNLQFDKAIQIYEEAYQDKDASNLEKLEALKSISQSFKLAQKKEDHILANQRMSQFVHKLIKQKNRDLESIKLYHDTELYLARSLWTEEKTQEAEKILNETIKKLTGKQKLNEIYYVKARIAEEKQEYPQAIENLEKALNEITTKNEAWEKYTWLKAWILKKQQKRAEAIVNLEALLAENNTAFANNKYRFWLARTYHEVGDKEKAKLELEKITQEDPLSFYAMTAYRDLNVQMPALKLNPDHERWLKTGTLTELDWYLALSEFQVARKYLDLTLTNTKKDFSMEDLYLFAKAEYYTPIFNYLNSLTPDKRWQLVQKDPELYFPREHLQIVEKASSATGVTLEHIYSIIRQESAFNQYARSSADAFGLMQLLPSIAKNISYENQISFTEADDLYEPTINIQVGSYLLKKLNQRWQNQFILSAASYNASEKAVLGWLKTRLHEDPLEFIEDIPYEETRTYVKLVMRNFLFYHRLQSQSETPFLEACLSGLQSFKN